ncbi:MarR family transcriptional regulator [Nonomuraea sp. NPDC005983]|uniref:MarR family winged helix-turn-helix transcriptional regulator n=1 Tax=Nonomuraea sp. NPDC005983 TaxID=3155595 RepID=UPI0033BDFFCF
MTDDVRWLDPAEARAWLGYRRMFLLLNRQVARDLARESGLSEADYDVLSNLSEAPGASMRLTELAAHMKWSKSRLSHHLTRMQQRGLVTRREHPSDGRGAVIVLTDEGLRTIQEAAPGHVASVRRHFIDLLTPEQLEAIGDISWTVVEQLNRA